MSASGAVQHIMHLVLHITLGALRQILPTFPAFATPHRHVFEKEFEGSFFPAYTWFYLSCCWKKLYSPIPTYNFHHTQNALTTPCHGSILSGGNMPESQSRIGGVGFDRLLEHRFKPSPSGRTLSFGCSAYFIFHLTYFSSTLSDGNKPKILVLSLFCYLGTEARSWKKCEALFCAGTFDGLALAK
jgi:hypothetical protein